MKRTSRMIVGFALLLAITLVIVSGCSFKTAPSSPFEPQIPERFPQEIELWANDAELAALPVSGALWDNLVEDAERPLSINLGSSDVDTPQLVARALVARRLGDEKMMNQVALAIMHAIRRGPANISSGSLYLSRKLVALVIAADLVHMQSRGDMGLKFAGWLDEVRFEVYGSRSVVSTHENRPNNWGTWAFASRVAVALYLGDKAELDRAIAVYRNWLGEETGTVNALEFGDLDWQGDPLRPVGINRRGARANIAGAERNVDGVLPDDQRRGMTTWPPPDENYVDEGLQGVLIAAVLLDRAGYRDVWTWGDDALSRAYVWLYDECGCPPVGNDTFVLPIIDRFLGTNHWDGQPTRFGRSLGHTGWLFQ